MRKICLTLFAVVLLVCGCGKKTETAALEDGKIYFFYYNECPYCHDAIDYIDRQYPNLNMAMVNIHVGNGFELFKTCGDYAQRVVGGIMFEQLSGSAGLVGIALRKQNFLVEEFFQIFF